MRDMPGLWVAFGVKGVSKCGSWDKMRPGLWASNLYWEGGGSYFCGEGQQYKQWKTQTTTKTETVTTGPILLPKQQQQNDLNFCNRCGEYWYKCECPIVSSSRYDNRDILAGMD